MTFVWSAHVPALGLLCHAKPAISPKLVKVKIEGSIYLATEVTLFLLIAEGYIRIYESPYQLSVSMLRLLVHWSYVSCHGRTSRAGIYWCAS